MDVFLLLGMLSLGVVIYFQYRLTSITDFIHFNGPLTVMVENSKEECSEYKDIIIKVSYADDSSIKLKAPVYFNNISTSRQRRLIKHTTRKEGIRTGKYIKYEICA